MTWWTIVKENSVKQLHQTDELCLPEYDSQEGGVFSPLLGKKVGHPTSK